MQFKKACVATFEICVCDHIRLDAFRECAGGGLEV